MRDALGIRERVEHAPETLKRLSAFAFERKPHGEATPAPRIREEEPAGTESLAISRGKFRPSPRTNARGLYPLCASLSLSTRAWSL